MIAIAEIRIARRHLTAALTQLTNDSLLTAAEQTLNVIRQVDVLLSLSETNMSFGLTQEERTIIDSGRIIEGIKELRTRTGLTLKDAKEAVDNYVLAIKETPVVLLDKL